MTDDPDLDAAARVEAVPEGIAVRAWFGLKQVNVYIRFISSFSSNEKRKKGVFVYLFDPLFDN